MKNILPLFIIGIFILSGFEAVAIINYSDNNYKIENEIITISTPILKDIDNNFIEINFKEATSIISYPNKPVLPIISRVYTLPFDSKIEKIDISYSDENKIHLTKKIIPGSNPIFIGDTNNNQNLQMNNDIYSSEELYPNDSYYYSTGVGLNNEKHVLYLIVQCYPIRYSPLQNSIYYYEKIDINIIYNKAKNPTIFTDEYDLVIIGPEQFSSEIQPLVEHKNNIGVNTFFKTTEDIFSEYDGFDKPEQIKYFIKDVVENSGVKYVLIIGGLNSLIIAQRKDDVNQGSIDWLVPVRYTNVNSGPTDDPGYISDLYYADLYRLNETTQEIEFEDWDMSNDGIFASWEYGSSRDRVDLYPDVYVGRLPCRNTKEVNTMVNKIISYESSPIDPSWFNKMIVIGGDTFNGGGNEGEIENQKALDYMEGFDPIKLWTSNRETGGLVPEPDDIIETISDGSGFLFFAGHGSPEGWYSYYTAKTEETEFYLWLDCSSISNGEKLPICVVGSCHGSQFNVTALSFINLYLHRIAEQFGWEWLDRWGGNCGFPTPECFNWYLTRVPNGGPISTIGNTGIGVGAVGGYNDDKDGDGINDPDCVEVYGGYLETLFFKMYGQENIDILGETWGQAITNYLFVYPAMRDRTDLKTVEQWALFGDPSLKIGGYP